jgi:hypothetical protein
MHYKHFSQELLHVSCRQFICCSIHPHFILTFCCYTVTLAVMNSIKVVKSVASAECSLLILSRCLQLGRWPAPGLAVRGSHHVQNTQTGGRRRRVRNVSSARLCSASRGAGAASSRRVAGRRGATEASSQEVCGAQGRQDVRGEKEGGSQVRGTGRAYASAAARSALGAGRIGYGGFRGW